ncbi:MAG: DUF308 domain-containing protein [Clostridia bacterium]|nr:DUF308 domain-containing protein [Clostridia bacterium]
MKKSEKIITACLTLAMGVLLLVLKGDFISILMSILGVGLIVLGIMDLVAKNIPSAIIKLICGVFVIVCGWVVVSAVLYVVAALLLVFGVLCIYYNLKRKVRGCTPVQTASYYIMPAICLFIGVLLLFHKGAAINIILIICGISTIIEGGILLCNAITEK